VGTRSATLTAVLLVASATACGHTAPDTDPATDPTDPVEGPVVVVAGSSATPDTPTGNTPGNTPGGVVWVATGRVDRVARRFTAQACGYDARREPRRGFLTDLAPIVTPDELERLRASARARLPWRVLRARGEVTRIRVDGVIVLPELQGRLGVVVRATQTTTTTFATVRDFLDVDLVLTHRQLGWRVAAAGGGCL
jgi:hypothetical protein